MSRKDIKPGMVFRSAYVEDDIFLFAFASSIIKGDGLYRRFNRVGGFVETDQFFKDDRYYQKHLCQIAQVDPSNPQPLCFGNKVLQNGKVLIGPTIDIEIRKDSDGSSRNPYGSIPN